MGNLTSSVGPAKNLRKPVAAQAQAGPSHPVDWSGSNVRKAFIDFFKGKDHVNWPSSSVVPINDPTLLFANAGTNEKNTNFHSYRSVQNAIYSLMECQ